MINVYDESGNIISVNLTFSCQYFCMIPKYFNLVKLGFRDSNMRRMFQLHLLYDHKTVAIPIWIFLICLLGIQLISPENPAISFSKIHICMYILAWHIWQLGDPTTHISRGETPEWMILGVRRWQGRGTDELDLVTRQPHAKLPTEGRLWRNDKRLEDK